MIATTTRNHAAFTLEAAHITWRCTVCGKPIRPSAGYLEADDLEARRRQDVWDKFITDHHGLINGAELLEAAGHAVPWLAYHRRCDPKPDAATYWIDVARIDSLRRLLHWAGHLAGKSWINSTDWADLLQRIGEYA